MEKFCGGKFSSNLLPKCRKEVDTLWSWIVCFCSTFIIGITLGIALNFGILFPALMDHFQETRERTAWVGSVGLALIFSLGAFTSVLVNRFGCRLTAFIGGLTCISGLLLSSLASNIAIMYVTYSVLFGFGSSCLFVSCYVITSQYFDKKRSIATGINSCGSGLGVIAIAPILQALLNTFGWRKTYRITAGIFSVVCVLCLTFDPAVARKDEKGTEQENEELENSNEENNRMEEEPKKWFIDLSVFREKVFIVLTLCHILVNLGHNTPRLHLAKFSEDLGVSADAASRLFMYIGITTFIGRLLSGFLGDMQRVNPVYVYMFGILLDSLDITFLTQATTYGHLIAFSFFYGLADGVIFGTFYISILYSVETSTRASAFGLSALCYGTTIATGPALAGFMTDRLHSYIPSFILAAAVLFVAAALLLILVCDKKQTQNFRSMETVESSDYKHRGTTMWETSL